jgi:hypothetical protein
MLLEFEEDGRAWRACGEVSWVALVEKVQVGQWWALGWWYTKWPPYDTSQLGWGPSLRVTLDTDGPATSVDIDNSLALGCFRFGWGSKPSRALHFDEGCCFSGSGTGGSKCLTSLSYSSWSTSICTLEESQTTDQKIGWGINLSGMHWYALALRPSFTQLSSAKLILSAQLKPKLKLAWYPWG